MIALEIFINGEKLYTIGASDPGPPWYARGTRAQSERNKAIEPTGQPGRHDNALKSIASVT